jgi:hypothetical protein
MRRHLRPLAKAIAILAASVAVGSCATVPTAVAPTTTIPPEGPQCQAFYYYQLPRYGSACSLTWVGHDAAGKKVHQLTCCG